MSDVRQSGVVLAKPGAIHFLLIALRRSLRLQGARDDMEGLNA